MLSYDVTARPRGEYSLYFFRILFLYLFQFNSRKHQHEPTLTRCASKRRGTTDNLKLPFAEETIFFFNKAVEKTRTQHTHSNQYTVFVFKLLSYYHATR